RFDHSSRRALVDAMSAADFAAISATSRRQRSRAVVRETYAPIAAPMAPPARSASTIMGVPAPSACVSKQIVLFGQHGSRFGRDFAEQEAKEAFRRAWTTFAVDRGARVV